MTRRQLLWSMQQATRTGELHLVEEAPGDTLVETYNAMLCALRASRLKQLELLGELGHDLRNPLTALRVNVDLLLSLHREGEKRTLPCEEHQKLREEMLFQFDRLAGLVDTLASLGNPGQSGSVRVDQLLNDIDEHSWQGHPAVAVHVSTIPWVVQGDAMLLGRGIVNVVDNALTWSPVGGVVEVELVAESERQAVLKVSDSGPGIAVEERERVLERFYRSPDAQETSGQGVGLAIAKRAMEELGGEITVGESTTGGALVSMRLPGRPG